MHLIDHISRHRDEASVLVTKTRVITAKELNSLSVCVGENNSVVGKSVLLALEDPLLLAIALVELDGQARRLVVTPAELPGANVFALATASEADIILSDRTLVDPHPAQLPRIIRARLGVAGVPSSERVVDTEWILLTSGTSGAVKLVRHNLNSLTHSITSRKKSEPGTRWGMFYNPASFAGLQVFLQSILAGDGIILTEPSLSVSERLTIMRE